MSVHISDGKNIDTYRYFSRNIDILRIDIFP